MAQDIPGSLKVSNDVIADLVGFAALECYGVVGMALGDQVEGAHRLLPTYRLRKGIDVSTQEGRVVVDLHVIVVSGVNITSVANNLVSAVQFVLAQIAELTDVDVRVHIEGMRSVS